jgi:hypothetical protein
MAMRGCAVVRSVVEAVGEEGLTGLRLIDLVLEAGEPQAARFQQVVDLLEKRLSLVDRDERHFDQDNLRRREDRSTTLDDSILDALYVDLDQDVLLERLDRQDVVEARERDRDRRLALGLGKDLPAEVADAQERRGRTVAVLEERRFAGRIGQGEPVDGEVRQTGAEVGQRLLTGRQRLEGVDGLRLEEAVQVFGIGAVVGADVDDGPDVRRFAYPVPGIPDRGTGTPRWRDDERVAVST